MAERVYTLKELNVLWQKWEQLPSVLVQRKIVTFDPQLEGQNPIKIAGIGSILFTVGFLDFLQSMEQEEMKRNGFAPTSGESPARKQPKPKRPAK